ncbi:hypothetical protein AB0F91_43360 [Amycolatopsis sp. NPDC023774]|uniref:hypothetical protein n=1 Tax=Amycolatopsis sp. NPDC023774 TaxID=3155015 RepID=UPI0033EC4CBC
MSAGEHLRLVWDGPDRGNYYNMIQYSAVRAAVVGAAQAVRILASDDSVARRDRGYIAITDTYVQLRKFHQLVLRQATELQLLTPEQVNQMRNQIAWAGSREDAVRAAHLPSRAERRDLHRGGRAGDLPRRRVSPGRPEAVVEHPLLRRACSVLELGDEDDLRHAGGQAHRPVDRQG